MKYLMKCGHVSSAIDEIGSPVCPICICFDIERKCNGNDGLGERKSLCSYCRKEVSSSWELPFFKYRPDESTDEYYCGCMGWD